MNNISFDWIPQVWGYLEPLIALLTFGFVFYTWFRIRRSYGEILESGFSGENVVVDFHGDFNPEASQGGWASRWKVVRYPLQGIDLNTPEGLERDLTTRLEEFKRQHPDLFGRLQSNDANVVVTMTGASSVLMLWMPMLHGIVGQFPKVTYSVRGADGGFVWSKPIDCQRIRLASSEQFRAIIEVVQPTQKEATKSAQR